MFIYTQKLLIHSLLEKQFKFENFIICYFMMSRETQ